MKSDALEYYIRMADKSRFLTRDEQFALARRYKKGDKAAGQKLVASNLRFALKVAHTYTKRGFAIEDLVQEANEGLCIALQKYDPDKGYLFITYAVWWIKARLQRFCNLNSSMVRLNHNRVSRIRAAVIRERQANHELADVDIAASVAKELKLNVELVTAAMNQKGMDQSLDVLLHGGSTTTHLEQMVSGDASPEDTAERESFRTKIRSCLSDLNLNRRDYDILTKRLMAHANDATTLQEIGDEYGISRERVRQVEEKLKKKIKGALEAVL